MTREEFALFLKDLRNVQDRGGDVDAYVKQFENRNVYFYNDGCIKKILASEKNIALTTDLINAALNLVGSDRIENPKLVNPYVPGELGHRSIEPDLLLTNERGDKIPRDRISIEIQHENHKSLYSDRLVFCVARLTNNMVPKGAVPQLENLHVISFQFFDAFKDSPNYRHTVQLRNQEQIVYFERQTVTLVEVGKFLRQADKFASDNCRIALWLRAIDALNREDDFSRYEGDPMFRILQNEVKMSNFTPRYMLNSWMKDYDDAVLRYEGAQDKAREMAAAMLAEGEPVDKIAKYTGLSESEILEIKATLDQK
ncbi:MAG: PD-(D/E)XK nuclease family transposase [Fibrobacter sp.]|uniref:PD-(D/E)XK nuclease family transposase n=1 Tax=Fibrobacter sp. TaxID=35828 RepID=UPI0025B8987E|nr:PD-(D/E)XK nuclease family transposase [Fibrobacter sp.]MBQ7081487.1 PD-(D/E)XK nuclease family transposase [Fibrobacter sp.]